jgi:hypothetical protein
MTPKVILSLVLGLLFVWLKPIGIIIFPCRQLKQTAMKQMAMNAGILLRIRELHFLLLA